MRWCKVTGILLVVVGCIGFVTVADDLRHTGELFGIGGIMMTGLLLLVGGLNYPITRRLHWVAVGIGIGIGIGATIGHMPTGIGGGAILGVVGAATLSPRRP